MSEKLQAEIERATTAYMFATSRAQHYEAEVERAHTDYSILKQDYDALRTDNERLKYYNQLSLDRCHELEAVIERLQADNERLREQVRALSDDLRLAWRREGALQARAALEQKP